MAQTWKTNGAAQKLLNVRFTTGEYNNDSKPKVIWESHPEFQKFKLATFRTHLNKTKARVGANLGSIVVSKTKTEDEDDDDSLPDDVISFTNPSPNKRREREGHGRDRNDFI